MLLADFKGFGFSFSIEFFFFLSLMDNCVLGLIMPYLFYLNLSLWYVSHWVYLCLNADNW